MNQCVVCGQEAIQTRPFEILPNNAMAMEAIHNDNLKHTWTEYRSQQDLGRRTEAQPIMIKCPECEQIGRLGSYRQDNTRQEFVTYYIKHGKGQTNKGTHYIKDRIQREQLLRELGRYIDPNAKAIAIEGNGNGNENAKPAFQQKIFPQGKELELCPDHNCKKLGYRYKTYFEHYNLAPVGKVLLRGIAIRDKYKRCYLPKSKSIVQAQGQKRSRARPKKAISQPQSLAEIRKSLETVLLQIKNEEENDGKPFVHVAYTRSV
jgi:hypothetical protein